jgi:hypothetical protein
MSMPAGQQPQYSATGAEQLVGRGALTHININGERVALIVPASLMAMMQILARLLVSGEASSQLPGLLREVFPWAAVLPYPELTAFAAEMSDVLRGGGEDVAELLEEVVISWRGTADIYGEPELHRALLQDGSDYGPVPAPPHTTQ